MTKTEMSRNKAHLKQVATKLDDLAHLLHDAAYEWEMLVLALNHPSVAACLDGSPPRDDSDTLRQMGKVAIRNCDALMARVKSLDAVGPADGRCRVSFTYCESRRSYVEYSDGEVESVGWPDEAEFTVTAAQAASAADWDRRYPGHEITEAEWFPEGELREAVFYQRTGVNTFSMVTVDLC